MTEYKFSTDEELNKQLNESFDLRQFYQLLENMFGFLAVRQLDKYDYKSINLQIAYVVRDICLKMESFYNDKRYTEAMQSSVNVLNAALAGARLTSNKETEEL